jgi:hypothetical protein
LKPCTLADLTCFLLQTGRWKITLKPSEGASDVMGIEMRARGGPGRKSKIFVFACESAGASESAIILRDTYIRPLISLCGQLLQQKEELVLRVQHGSSDDGGGRSAQHTSSRRGVGGGGGYGPSDVMTSSDFDSQSFDAKFVNAAGQVPTDAAAGDRDEGDGDVSSTDHSRSPFEGDFGGGVYTSFMALLHCQAQGGADPSDEDSANSHGNDPSTQAHCGRGGSHKIPECTPVSSTQRPAGRSLNIDDDDDDDGGGGGGGARAGRPCAAGAASSTMPPPYAQSSAADTGMDSDDSDEEGMAALFAQEAANSQHPRPPSPLGVNILSQAHSRRASGELLLTGSAKRQKHSTSPQSKAASRSRASGGTSATASTQPPAPPKARPGKSKKKRRDRFFG